MKIILNDGKTINKSLETLEMKQYEYWKYGKKLALENKLGHRLSFNEQTLENLKDLDIFTYTEHDISETIDFLNKWIINETDEYDVPYKLYTEEELDKLFENCFQFTTDYLQKLKETK